MAYSPLIQMATVDEGGAVQENASVSIRRILSKGVLDGELIENVTIQGGSVENKISHRLPRKAKGFIVVSKSATGDIWGTPALQTVSVYTTSSTALRLNLWVF